MVEYWRGEFDLTLFAVDKGLVFQIVVRVAKTSLLATQRE